MKSKTEDNILLQNDALRAFREKNRKILRPLKLKS